MKLRVTTLTVVVGVVAFVLYGGQAAAQEHGAGHDQASLTAQLMGADANEDGSVTTEEIVSLLLGGLGDHAEHAEHGDHADHDAHHGGDTDGAAHHETAEGHGNPHGDGGGHADGNLAALLGGQGAAAIADMSRADLETRVTMLVSHADTNSDAALNATEAAALVAMIGTMRAGGGH